MLLMVLGAAFFLSEGATRSQAKSAERERIQDGRAGGGSNGSGGRDQRDGPPLKDRRLKPLIEGGKYRLSEEQIERYFASVGRTKQALIAVYLLNRDERFLEELRKFPDSATALEMLATFGSNEEQAEADAERLMELRPDDPSGYYLFGMWQARRGDVEQAVETLKKVRDLEGELSIDTLELHNDLVDSLMLMGYDMVEANVYLVRHPVKSFTGSTDFNRIMYSFLRKGAVAEGERAYYASELLAINQRIAPLAPTVSLSVWDHLKSEATLLGLLPPDMEYGESNTVGSRRTEVREMMEQERAKEERAFLNLQKLEPAEVNIYYELVGQEGAIVARDWLLSQ